MIVKAEDDLIRVVIRHLNADKVYRLIWVANDVHIKLRAANAHAMITAYIIIHHLLDKIFKYA